MLCDIFAAVYFPAIALYMGASVTCNFGPHFKHAPDLNKVLNDLLLPEEQLENSTNAAVPTASTGAPVQSPVTLESYYNGAVMGASLLAIRLHMAMRVRRRRTVCRMMWCCHLLLLRPLN